MRRPPVNKPVEDLPRKLVRYADILAAGSKTMKAAAIEAGYTPNTADKQAYQWIGRTREQSMYPQLFDYYQKLRCDKLRHYDISEDTVTKELRTIGFSSIESFLELPREAVHKKAQKMREQLEKLYNRLSDYKIIDDLAAPVMTENGPAPSFKYSPQAKPVMAKIKKLEKQVKAIEEGPGYTLKLKFREEIPDELMPAIAEIRETREGISVKLHNKLDALDKLARWMRLYDNKSGGPDGNVNPDEVTDINITIKGSKSEMHVLPKEDAA